MKPKAILPLLFCLLYFNHCFAQRRNIYYLKNSGEQVKLLDSADFIRVVSEPDSESKWYNVHDYYKDKKTRFIGKSSEIDPVKLEGQGMSYYPSGKKKQYANYKNGLSEGDVYVYYPNGTLYTYQKYKQIETAIGAGHDYDCVTLSVNDSVGKQLVVDGNGGYIGYGEDFKEITSEGNLKDGHPNGKWKGSGGGKKDYLSYTEEYKDGKLVAGQSVDKGGNAYSYTSKVVEPEFNGGIKEFYKFLAKNIYYPEHARLNNITGKVFIAFVVEKDGSLSNVKVTTNPNDELSTEALRVVKKSPKWTPGLAYGRLARISYTVPVNFTLSGR